MIPNWSSEHTDALIMYPHLFHSYTNTATTYICIMYIGIRITTIPLTWVTIQPVLVVRWARGVNTSRRPRRPSYFPPSFLAYLPKPISTAHSYENKK